MKDSVHCPSCRGTKVILGDGLIEHPCEYCKGKGVIEVIEQEVCNKIAVIIDNPVVKDVIVPEPVVDPNPIRTRRKRST